MMDTQNAISPNVVTYSLVLGTVVLALIFVMILWLSSDDQTWAKCGVVQVDPGILGFVDVRDVFRKFLDEHGDTVGFQQRGDLRLLTCDFELIQQIMVKDFSNFVNRNQNPVTRSKMMKSLFFTKDQTWKRQRQLLSSTFTTGKLKIIAKIVDQKAKRFCDFLLSSADSGQLVPLKKMTGKYAGEIIAESAFGLRMDCFGQEVDEFTTNSTAIFRNWPKYVRYALLVLFRFHWLHSFLVKTLRLSYFDVVNPHVMSYFESILQDVIAQRLEAMREGRKVPTDLLQLLLNANELEQKEQDKTEGETGMSMDEIIAQSILIIFAGYETTATSLQFILYLLARHPDAQEKVVQEIRKVVKGDIPSHEELHELKFMGQVINEALRLYSPVPLVDRVAIQTKTYGNTTIPAGTGVIIPIYYILTSAKFFAEPDKFLPERFSGDPEHSHLAPRDSMCFLAFGAGPRHCIGKRLALLELKHALVHVLRKVKFVVNQTTTPAVGEEVRLKTHGITAPVNPIHLAVERREEVEEACILLPAE